jgi:uncharacterized membrane protein SpoIIM required for sporulation
MVLEALINPKHMPKSRWRLGIIGVFYAFVAGVLAYYMFQPYASIVMVFFTVMLCIPFMHTLIKTEEEKEESLLTEKSFIDEYGHVVMGLIMLFVGVTIGYLLLYFIAPAPMQTQLFSAQQETISAINGNIVAGGIFTEIFLNNLFVLGISLAFAFLYGFGAITIIIWNSSVVAAALAGFIMANAQKATTIGAGIWGLFRYLAHGIPEIASYLVAGLAGGIISVAVINHEFGTKKWGKVIRDATQLAVLSILLVIIGALIEVFITPWFY